MYEDTETHIGNNYIVIRESERNVVKGEITVQLMSKIPIIQENKSKVFTELSKDTCLDTDICKNDTEETIEDEEKISCKDNSIINDKEFTETVNTLSYAESVSGGDNSNENIETICPEDHSTNYDNLIDQLEKITNSYLCPKEDSNEKAFNEDGEASNKSIVIQEKADNNLTSLTKEEVDSFETNSSKNDVECTASQESYKNIQEEIESLLAPMTPLPDLESVDNVIKINKINDIDMNTYPDDSDEKNDNKFVNEKLRFSFPNDKKSKDCENSAIASSSSLGKSSIHSCLEDSLRKLEDTMHMINVQLVNSQDRACSFSLEFNHKNNKYSSFQL